MQKPIILFFLTTLNILFAYYLLAHKLHPSLRYLQQIVPINPFQPDQNATKPGPVVQSSGSQTQPISVLNLINQLQNGSNGNTESEFGEDDFDSYELENLKSYGWGIIDYFSHFENTEVSNDFGATSTLSSDQKTCNIDLLSQETVASSGTLNASNVNITQISLNDYNGKIDSIKYSGTFCQCWIILWEGYNFTGASWGFMVNYDQTVNSTGYGAGGGGQINLAGLTDSNSQCEEINANSSISSYELHCYNF